MNLFKKINWKDKRGTFFYVCWKIRVKLYRFFCGIIVTMQLFIKGIKVGKKCRYYGSPYITRYPGSSIRIGNDCCFVSNSIINFRGINHRCILQTGKADAKIIIGEKCGFSGVSIVADKLVKLGNHVTVGANSIIGDRDGHPEIFNSQPQPVLIGDNVWIGMNCTILKGVSIGENSIIGANSVVTKNIPSNVIAVGNPCRVIRERIIE